MAASFENDAEATARALSDAAAALHERDAAKRAGGNAVDAGSKLRAAITKADKQLDKIVAAAKASEAASTSVCVAPPCRVGSARRVGAHPHQT